MGNVAELDTTRLVIAAIIGLALLLVLIIKFKVHAFHFNRCDCNRTDRRNAI